MVTVESVQEVLDPLFPGLIGLRIVAVAPERVVAELTVRPDPCTWWRLARRGLHGVCGHARGRGHRS